MNRKLKEWMSIQREKNPRGMILMVILLFNVAFLMVSAAVISALSLRGTERMGFMEAAFYTITMILDAGCISFVVADIGTSGVVVSVFCLCVVVVGMISFTGAVVGYITNYIANFVDNAHEGKHRIFISDHVVILNWNSKASEIVNDFLYREGKQKIVVLVNSRKEQIQQEIEERLTDTIARENLAVEKQYDDLALIPRLIAIRKNRFRRNLTVLVREGDVFSTKQLREISLDRARSIIILGNDVTHVACKYEREEIIEKTQGNAQIVKTLMQVADITSSVYSAANQKIIVEITDPWTDKLVRKIIESKQVEGRCNIVPLRVNMILGQILSQFSLMPELNLTYEELFSSRGAEFYTKEQPLEDMAKFARKYLLDHKHAIPLTFMGSEGKIHCYYAANDETDVERRAFAGDLFDLPVKLNRDFWLQHKYVVILGHNSKSRDIMQGFHSFCCEWDREGSPAVSIVVVDDAKSLEKMNYYRDYPFVVETVAADIYNEELICSTIERIVSINTEDTSILILSDDTVASDDMDANALANLIYVQEIINRKKSNSDFNPCSIDVIVEIMDPKHHDIVNSYSVNNVVISNRYISKMIAQIGEVDALFDFYTDILSYDEDDVESKEIYIKKASEYFEEIPGPCTAAQLIRGVLMASTSKDLPPEARDPNMVLGYVKANGEKVIFGGNQAAIRVALEPDDKLIIFSSH